MLSAGAKVQRYLILWRSCGTRGLLLFASATLAACVTMAREGAALDDSRTLTFFHTHTQESATVTFRRGGAYVADGLTQLNHVLRDWRVEQSTTMDPRLFDIIWEVHRAVGSRAPVHIISAYRSPQTNQALRNRSRAVSEQSQHMLGRAMDIRFPDVDAARVREAAMRLQHGGVGFYPGANFVHVDVGSVRAWPRMTREQLVRLFPHGKTVHLPPDGNPLPGYEQARAEIMSRAPTGPREAGPQRRSLWASLFGEREGGTPRPAAGAPDEALANAPLPPRREGASADANAADIPDLGVASLRILFSKSPLAVSPQPRVRVTTVKVTARAVPSDTERTDFAAIPLGAPQWAPSAAPEMEEAMRELGRRLGERAKMLAGQHTSSTTGSITAASFTP
jgi:uncharacterized protein YcbK (DUF882 family)